MNACCLGCRIQGSHSAEEPAASMTLWTFIQHTPSRENKGAQRWTSRQVHCCPSPSPTDLPSDNDLVVNYCDRNKLELSQFPLYITEHVFQHPPLIFNTHIHFEKFALLTVFVEWSYVLDWQYGCVIQEVIQEKWHWHRSSSQRLTQV